MVFKTMCVDEITQMCGSRQEKNQSYFNIKRKKKKPVNKTENGLLVR